MKISCFHVFIHIPFTFSVIYALNCPHPDADVNSKVKSTGLEPGAVASYTCDTDYRLFGNEVRTCKDDGSWSGEAPMCATNVAWRKPVNQSSTARGGPPENANDGDKSTLHDGSKCTETLVEDSPWWSVDLLQSYEISHLRVIVRGCCDNNDIQDLEVRVGFSAELQQRNRLCAWNPGKIEKGSTLELKCARPISGRYVFIQMVGVMGSLSLCEVEVFSKQELSKDRCKGNFDESKLGLFNRTCYEFQITSGGSFEIAQNYCKKRKEGNLVHGIEPMTQKFLVSELKRLEPEMQTKMLWIGVQKEPQFISRVWRWIDGTKVLSPSWGREQPNNYNGEQNCVVLDGTRDWLWNDVGCKLNYLVWMCQFQPSCGSPDRQVNTTFTIQENQNEVVASYECSVGNMVVGTQERICSPTGFWTSTAPTCKYVECGNPPSPVNGAVSLLDQRTNFGARASYVCGENYTLNGNETVTCGENSQWLPKIPECLYSWCPSLDSPENGMINLSGRKAGDTASFLCDSGYYLVGKESLTCSLGGTWSGKPPNCRFIDCGLLKSPENGKMTLVNSTTYVGSYAFYDCNDDYKLVGLKARLCEYNGLWTGEEPVCTRINCGEPIIPLGGYVTGYSFEVHSEVEYHCDLGHYMTGDAVTKCTSAGSWTGVPPNCTFVDCGRLPPLIKGEIRFEDNEKPTYLGSTVHYTCNSDYALFGSEKRVCERNGQWSGDHPSCEEIRCPEVENLPKGRYGVSGNDRRISLAISRTRHHMAQNSTYKIGSVLTYRCERGYAVEGNRDRTCLTNGSWSGASPRCKHVDCGLPNKVENGVFRLLSNETSYGSVVAYECEQNWRINGKVRRFCQENGTWSGPQPECLEIKCPSLSEQLEKAYKEIDNREVEPWNKELLKKRKEERELRLMVEDGDRRVGSKATYECRKGQILQGKPNRICQLHGVWEDAQPSCEWVFCERPPDIVNGRLHLVDELFKFGSVVEYFCFPKFYLKGPFNRTCSHEGTWTGVDPICTLDDTDLGSYGENTVDGHSDSQKGSFNDSDAQASYTGIYAGIGVSFILVAGVLVALVFYKMRENRLGKVSSSSSSNASTKPVERSYPSAMTYGDLSDPTTGNNIYEHIPDDFEAPYSNMSPTNNTFSSTSAPPPQHYSNYHPAHTYSNAANREHYYSNSSPSSSTYSSRAGVPSNIAMRPKMPPPQPPRIPRSDSSAGVTVNGVAVNNS